MELSDIVVRNHAASKRDRDNALRRYADAKRQMDILLSAQSTPNTDFYVYRYLASQVFCLDTIFHAFLSWHGYRKEAAKTTKKMAVQCFQDRGSWQSLNLAQGALYIIMGKLIVS